MSVAEVILAAPLPQLARQFEYAIPTELVAQIVPGVRVKVPLGRRRKLLDAYVVEISASASFDGKLQSIAKVVSPIPVLTADLLKLAQTIADRQAGITADVLRLAIPPRTARVEKSLLAAFEQGIPGPQWQLSQHQQGTLTWAQPGFGVVQIDTAPDATTSVPRWALELAQHAVAEHQRGRSAIIVAPDFRDLDLLEAALISLGATTCHRLDAHQSDHLRYKSFLEIMHSGPTIVIGNRSAAYAPAQNLSWIGMWDDGDPLYIEPMAPYAHSRDVILVRQQLFGINVTFMSHARSVAVHRLIEIGWVHPSVPASGPQVISTAQMNQDYAPSPGGIESVTVNAIREGIATGPVLIQVARRGWATAVVCADCDTPLRCMVCAGPLFQPDQGALARCRWCHREASTFSCAGCGGHNGKFVGRGQQRNALDLARLVPGVQVVHSNGSNLITHVDAKPKIVVATAGTEPVATGGYAAICILDAGKALARESIDASEQALRVWMNAAALSATTGRVVVQDVKDTLAAALATWKSELLASRELSARAALGLPPVVRLAIATGTAEKITALRTEVTSNDEYPGVSIIGSLGRIADKDTGTELRRIMIRVPYSVSAKFAALAKSMIVSAALQSHASLRVRFDLDETAAND